ncbi:MAG: hypothetical protein ACC631_08915, partial [Halocynthiibacter sp.]
PVAAVSAGAVDAGLDCLRRAAADAEKINDRALFAISLQELGTSLIHAKRGFDDEGAILLHQAVELAVETGLQQVAANALRELGYTEALAGRRPLAAEYLDQAMDYSQGNKEALAGAHAVSGFNLVDWGKYDEGLAHFEQSLELARSAGNRRREIWALGIGGWGQLLAGRTDVARDWLQNCIELCDEIRWVAFQPWPQAILAETKLKLNEDSNSLLSGLEESLAMSRQLGDPCWEAANSRAIGLIHGAANDIGAAMKWMDRARESCCSVSDLYAGLLVEILMEQVKLYDRSGQARNASSTARELLALAAKTHADAHLKFAVSMVNVQNGLSVGNSDELDITGK